MAPTLAFGAALALFVILCYWPLTRFYLAQDDFILLEKASHGWREAMAPYFSTRPGQFRPLTKGLYFMVAWPLFGLKPLPYHVVSLLLHACNSILVAVVMRRMKISRAVSAGVAVLFAGHLAHMEAIAWASCVQQLLGALFTFVALIFGLEVLAGGGRRPQVAASAAYLLALCSYEQTVALPLVLLASQCLRGGWRSVPRAAWGPLRPMLALFAVYAVYAASRGTPESGPYVMSLGKNVIENLRVYTSIAFSVWFVYPSYGLPLGFTASHAAWIAMAVVHALLRTLREFAFGCATFLLFLAPVLFTSQHTHSFHIYVPAIGVCFLVASAVESIRSRMESRWRVALAVGTAAILIGAAGSVVTLRKNVNTPLSGNIPLPRSFVLRRAVLAQRLCSNIRARWTPGETRLFLFYPSAQLAPNWRNVQNALGFGSAVRLVLNQPGLDVIFIPPEPQAVINRGGALMIYTELGDCFTVAEWKEFVSQHPELQHKGGDGTK